LTSPADRNRVWRADPELAAALEALGWPDRSALESAFGQKASSGRSATALLALPGRPERLHLRRVQHGGWLGPLWAGAIWGADRPLEEWEAHTRLHAAGAPVPRPALVAAWRARGPLWTAVYGTVHVEGARDGVVWLAEAPPRPTLLDGARAAGAAIRRFHDAGGAHSDLHLKNLLFRPSAAGTGAGVEAWVIDLDRARVGSPPGPARRMRELMRLLRSLSKRGVAEQVGARGCAAAFGAYCAGDRALRRQLLMSRAWEERRNALHALAYRKPPPPAASTSGADPGG